MAKRAMDLILGGIGLLLAFPLIAVCAILVQLVDRGPAFYYQAREGYLGRPIRLWKLRTMYVNSEDHLQQHLRENPSARREWDKRYKLQRDPRVIPLVGPALRRLGIDVRTVRKGIEEWMEEHGFESVEEFRGRVSQIAVPDPSELERANYIGILDSYSFAPGTRT